MKTYAEKMMKKPSQIWQMIDMSYKMLNGIINTMIPDILI